MTDKRESEEWETTRYPGLFLLKGTDDRWRFRIYDPRTGKPIQRRVSGVGIREAKAQMDKAREESRRSSRRRRGRPPTVREYGEEWRTDKVHAPSSVGSLESDLRLYVYPAFGPNRPIDEVTHRHVSRFVNTLAASSLSVATQGRIDAHARQLFNAAVADEEWTGLQRSPFAREPRIVKGKTDAQLRQGEYVPTMTEAVRMADLAVERGRVDVAAFILMTIGTGMRSGEIRGASAEQIDYPKQTRIYVDQQVQFDKVDGLGDDKAIHYYTTPKSRAGKRTVPLAPFVVETLSTLTAWRAPREITLPWIVDGFVRGDRTRLLLMPGRFGGTMHKATIGKAVAKIADDAGVSRTGIDGERLGVTPNTLRKVFATLLDGAGVPRKAVDYVTGHASEGVTLKHYTDVTEPGLIAVRDAVQAAYVAARVEIDEAAETDEQTASD